MIFPRDVSEARPPSIPAPLNSAPGVQSQISNRKTSIRCPSKRIHSGFYSVVVLFVLFAAGKFQPSKRIHSGFYGKSFARIASTTTLVSTLQEDSFRFLHNMKSGQHINISRFNPPRGFIPVSTRRRHRSSKVHSDRFQPSKRIHSGFYIKAFFVMQMVVFVSTLQEDSFRFLPSNQVVGLSWNREKFQPSKRIHSGFYMGF